MAFDVDAFLDTPTKETPKAFDVDAFLDGQTPRVTPQVADISPEELRAQARAGVGVFPTENRLSNLAQAIPGGLPSIIASLVRPEIQAMAEGALAGGSVNLSDAIARRQGINLNDPQGARFQSPYSFSLGEIVGGAAPQGRLVGGASTGLGLALRGGTSGALQGIAQGVGEEATQAAPTLEGAIERSIVPGAIGATIGAVAPTLPLGLKKLAVGVSRLPTQQIDRLTFVTGAKNAGKVFKDTLNEGGFDDILPDIARAKKQSGAAGVDSAIETLNKESADIFNPHVKSADPEDVIFQKANIMARIDERLTNRISNPDTRARVLKSIERDYIDSVNPENLTSYTREIGGKLRNFYKSPDQGKYAEKIYALEAARNVFGENIRNILAEKGIDPGVWSRYGKINELGDQISKNYGNELTTHRALRGEGLLSKSGVEPGDLLQKVPLLGTALRAGKNIKERMSGGVPALLDERIDELFSKVKKSKAPKNISVSSTEIPPTLQEVQNARNLAMAQSIVPNEIPNIPANLRAGPYVPSNLGVPPSAPVLPGQANLDALIASYGAPNPMGPFPQAAPLNQLEQAIADSYKADALRIQQAIEPRRISLIPAPQFY